MMYLGLDGRYDDLPHHTIYTAENYQQNLDDIERAHRLSDDPSFYVQNACVTDPTPGPGGNEYALRPGPGAAPARPTIDWTRRSPALPAGVLRQLAKIGLTDVERRIRFEKVVTPADWESNYAVFKGATFNLAHSLDADAAPAAAEPVRGPRRRLPGRRRHAPR